MPSSAPIAASVRYVARRPKTRSSAGVGPVVLPGVGDGAAIALRGYEDSERGVIGQRGRYRACLGAHITRCEVAALCPSPPPLADNGVVVMPATACSAISAWRELMHPPAVDGAQSRGHG